MASFELGSRHKKNGITSQSEAIRKRGSHLRIFDSSFACKSMSNRSYYAGPKKEILSSKIGYPNCGLHSHPILDRAYNVLIIYEAAS